MANKYTVSFVRLVYVDMTIKVEANTREEALNVAADTASDFLPIAETAPANHQVTAELADFGDDEFEVIEGPEDEEEEEEEEED